MCNCDFVLMSRIYCFRIHICNQISFYAVYEKNGGVIYYDILQISIKFMWLLRSERNPLNQP